MQSPFLRVPTLRAPFAALCAVLLLALTLVTIAPGVTGVANAAPCTCKKPKSGSLLDQADVLVTGTVAGVDDSVTPAQFDLKLSRVYAGADSIDTDTLSFVQDPDCPLSELAGQQTWIVGARRVPASQVGSRAADALRNLTTTTPGATWADQQATGQATDPASDGPVSLGTQGSTPTASAPDSPSGSATGSAEDQVLVAIGCNVTGPQTSTRMRVIERNFGTGTAPVKPEPKKPELTKVETAGPERFTRLAAPGAAMFVIGLLGFVAVRRLGRPKR